MCDVSMSFTVSKYLMQIFITETIFGMTKKYSRIILRFIWRFAIATISFVYRNDIKLIVIFCQPERKNDSYLIHIVIIIIKCLEWKYQFFKHVVMSKWVWSVFLNIFLFLAQRRILKNTEFSSGHHVSVSELNKLINYCNQDQR